MKKTVIKKTLWILAALLFLSGCVSEDVSEVLEEDKISENMNEVENLLNDLFSSQEEDGQAHLDSEENHNDTHPEQGDIHDSTNSDVIEYAVEVFLVQSHSIYLPKVAIGGVKDGGSAVSLVRNREALINVKVSALGDVSAPTVMARVSQGGRTLVVPLTGPDRLPENFDLFNLEHKVSDSFIGTIPADWFKPPMKVEIVIDDVPMREYDLFRSSFGLSTAQLELTMFDFHFFSLHSGDFPEGWEAVLEKRLPFRSINLNRVHNVIFKEMVMPPKEGQPAVLIQSKQDYTEQTGLTFDGTDVALAWVKALDEPNSGSYPSADARVAYANLYGADMASSGNSKWFSAVGKALDTHSLFKQLFITLSGFSGSNFNFTKKESESMNDESIPVWGYDHFRQTFVSEDQIFASYSQDISADNKDPYPFLPPTYILSLQHSFSVNFCTWNEEKQTYEWTDIEFSCGNFSIPIEETDADVLSFIINASGANPSVNYIYPAIGPYRDDVFTSYDPTDPVQLSQIDPFFCPKGGCDYTIRVTQGGQIRHYLLSAAWLPDLDPTDPKSLITQAINLPVELGEVSKIELLLTPNAHVKGIPSEPEVLFERISE